MSARAGPGLVGRVGLAVVAAEAIAILLLWFLVSSELAHRAMSATRERVDALAAALAARYAPIVREGDAPGLLDAVLQDGARLNVRISVVREDGALAGDSHARADVDANALLGSPSIVGALVGESGIGRSVLRDSELGGRAVMTAMLIAPRPNRAALRIGALAPARAAAHRAAALIVLPPGALAILATALLLRWAASRLREDARALAEDARTVEAGDLAHRLRPARTPELRDLGEAVNAMLARLTADLERHRMRSKERRAVIRSMPGAVVALDVDQRILSVNKVGERMLHIREKHARGRLLQEVLRQPQLNRFVQHAFEAGGRFEDEFELDNDESIIVQAASRPLRSPREEIVGRVVVLQDVTRLRRLERVRRDFAANVSHELRTPITNIKGYVETLQESSAIASEEDRRHIAVIARNADRLRLIVEDMLELARLEDSDAAASLALAPTDVHDVLRAACEHARDAAAARPVALEVNCEPGLVVRASRRLLEQAVGNLLSNAIRHSPAQGVVRVEAHRRKPEDADAIIEIAVIDHGPGIRKQHLPRLFERFYRVDPARSRAEGGTGLGLAIVKHIARLHHGREGVESILGKGSRFWIRLPECETTENTDVAGP